MLPISALRVSTSRAPRKTLYLGRSIDQSRLSNVSTSYRPAHAQVVTTVCCLLIKEVAVQLRDIHTSVSQRASATAFKSVLGADKKSSLIPQFLLTVFISLVKLVKSLIDAFERLVVKHSVDCSTIRFTFSTHTS